MSFLQIKDLAFSYGSRQIFESLSLAVNKQERLCILGPSGCGKTSLLRLCAGLERPDSGQIFLRDQRVAGDSHFVSARERGIAFVFQNFALFEKIKVRENIEYGCLKPQHRSQSEKLIELLKLAPHLEKYPHQLSGGERQKVALARALVQSPDLVLLDEPFSSIDSDQTDFLIDEIVSLFETLEVTALMVTHSAHEADRFATRIFPFT